MNRLMFLWQGAQYQDRLLQSYRNFHFILQSVLLAVGAGLSTVILLAGDQTKAKAVYVLLIVVTGISLYLLRVMHRLIVARSEDVNYYHRQIIAAEKEFQHSEQVLTSFKFYQKYAKGTEAAGFSIPEITDAMRAQLIEKGKGHTRQTLGPSLSNLFLAAWLSFHVIVLLTAFGKAF